MLGGSSSLNYMVYVRGHPGDFDSWAEGGATGWSYTEVLPYFRKSEGLAPSGEVVIDAQAHNVDGPLGVSVRSPVLPAASDFVEAAVAAGIPRGDYNGRDRGGAVSLVQSTTRRGKRSSTYHAFLEGEPECRPNLTIITGAQATRVIVDGEAGQSTAGGVEYRTASGEMRTAQAGKEVILSAGAIGSPHLLLLSGIGPRRELEAVGVPCVVGVAPCRQAFERSSHGSAVLSRARCRRDDERDLAVDGTGGVARPRRTAARRPRR